MNDTLIKLYESILNFRATQKYVEDIDIVYSYIEYYSRPDAINCTNFYLQKYKKTLTQLGKFAGGVKLVYNNYIYKEKTDEDIVDDLMFCIWGIICSAYVEIGFSKNVKDFVISYLS